MRTALVNRHLVAVRPVLAGRPRPNVVAVVAQPEDVGAGELLRRDSRQQLPCQAVHRFHLRLEIEGDVALRHALRVQRLQFLRLNQFGGRFVERFMGIDEAEPEEPGLLRRLPLKPAQGRLHRKLIDVAELLAGFPVLDMLPGEEAGQGAGERAGEMIEAHVVGMIEPAVFPIRHVPLADGGGGVRRRQALEHGGEHQFIRARTLGRHAGRGVPHIRAGL